MTVRLASGFVAAMMLLAALTAGCSKDGSSPLRPPQYPAEYYVLLKADVLAGASIGFSGITPETVIAYRALLNGPVADAYFKSLVEEATLPGQLYALAGIYFTDPEAVSVLAAPFMVRDDLVPTIFGCIMADQPVSDMASLILSGSLPQQFRGEMED